MAITAADLLAIRTEYVDIAEAAFTDDQITTIWDDMAGAVSTYEQRRATIGQMFVIARNKAVKLRDYSQGETSEKASQVFKQLSSLVTQYQDSIDAAIGTKSEIARSTMRPRPHQTRDYPVDDPRFRLKEDRVLKDSSS